MAGATIVVALILGGLAASEAQAAASGTISAREEPRNGAIVYSTDETNEIYDEGCGDEGTCEADPVRLRIVRPQGGRGRGLPCATRSGRCADESPTFSPDGRLISHLTAGGLAVRQANGRILGRLTLQARSLAWAPGGRRLAAVVPEPTATDTDSAALYLIRRDGGRARRVLSLPGLRTAEWSPRGRALVLTTARPTPDGESHGEISVVRPDGSGLQRVATGMDYERALWPRPGVLIWNRAGWYPGTGDIMSGSPAGGRVRRLARRAQDPVLSPDGRRALFHCYRGTCTVEIGSGRRRLVGGQCDGLQTGYSWSPDGRSIACGAPSGALVRIGLRSRRARTITRGAFPGPIDWQRQPLR